MKLGWYDCTKPSTSTSLQGILGVHRAYVLVGVVQMHQTSSNPLEPHHCRDSKVCRVLSHEFVNDVQSSDSLIRGSSSTSNLIEPFQTNSTAILELILLPFYCHCTTIPQPLYSSFYCHFTYDYFPRVKATR